MSHPMIALLLLAAICDGDCRAQSQFAAMERRLLARPLQLEVRSHAEGAVQADATAEIFIGPATRVHTKGAFMGTPFARDFDQPTTTDLRDAVLIGLSRMGALHNLIEISQGNPPDHAAGGVREWLQAVKFRRVKGGVSYVVHVEGKDTGEATLLIDARTRLPRSRKLTVHFPNGDMLVTETYRYPKKR